MAVPGRLPIFSWRWKQRTLLFKNTCKKKNSEFTWISNYGVNGLDLSQPVLKFERSRVHLNNNSEFQNKNPEFKILHYTKMRNFEWNPSQSPQSASWKSGESRKQWSINHVINMELLSVSQDFQAKRSLSCTKPWGSKNRRKKNHQN